MRDRRRAPAGGVQAEKQLRYVRLIAAGVNNSEACRLVGINRKTGNRWRYGRAVLNTVGEPVHYPPVKITPVLTFRMISGVRGSLSGALNLFCSE